MHKSIADKIADKEQISRLISVWRLKSNRIVFTNGVFDLTHPGHADYLAQASDLGHRLVVGINSDASVRTLNKGTNRPINEERARASIVAALRSVDAVVIFEESTPENLIKTIVPDVLVKGGDYDSEETNPRSKQYIVGSDIVLDHGGKVVSIPLLEGYSSTRIIEKILSDGQS